MMREPSDDSGGLVTSHAFEQVIFVDIPTELVTVLERDRPQEVAERDFTVQNLE